MRTDFPLLEQRDVTYLDNAATTQKPRRVIDALSEFYEEVNANPHRSLYGLANDATTIVESARSSYAEALDCASHEVFFTRNATESLNQVAKATRPFIGAENRIVTTTVEHHSNFLPWQRLADERDASLTVVPHDELDDTADYVDEQTNIVAITHMSNVTGEYVPVEDIAKSVKERSDAFIVVDGCQAFPHQSINIGDTAIDAYVFSAHKHYGPTGIGITYLDESYHETIEPPLVGGGMVNQVSKNDYEPNGSPHRFESGTLNAAGIAGSKEALRFLEENRAAIREKEADILSYTLKKLDEAGFEYYGHDENKRYGPVISLKTSIDAYDIAHVLNKHGVCIRAGNHCADPLMDALGETNTPRISLACYNDYDDIDNAINALQDAKNLLGGTA